MLVPNAGVAAGATAALTTGCESRQSEECVTGARPDEHIVAAREARNAPLALSVFSLRRRCVAGRGMEHWEQQRKDRSLAGEE